MSTSTRKAQICGTHERDFISDLPDGVIGHILSCLPIKDVMRTTVLSKDWKSKWTFAYNVELVSGDILPIPQRVLTLVNIVEKLLIGLKSLRSFSMISFICRDDELSRMETLLHALFRRDIDNLTLVVSDHDNLVLPLSILNRTSLRNFEFTMGCILKAPGENCFPNLSRMSLAGIEILNEVSDNDTLIFKFPVLKTFELVDCNWLKVKCVEIHAPALTMFDVSTTMCTEKNEAFGYSIKVLGSNLSMFRVAGDYIENFVLSDSTVATADLSCYHDNSLVETTGEQVRKLLWQLTNIESLIFSEMLLAIAATKQGNVLPRFNKLEKLYVHLPFSAEGLLELLNAAPFLRKLVLMVPYDCDYDFDAVESLPSCVLNHLEKVRLDYNCDSMKYLDFSVEKFLLKNGLRLKTVLAYVFARDAPSSLGDDIVEQLSTFPKGCEVLVEEWSKIKDS